MLRSEKKQLRYRSLKKSGKIFGMSVSSFQLYSLCIIPVLHVFLFNYVPMFGIILAFKNYNYAEGILGSPWVGFDNFKFFFQTDIFWRITRNTVGMNVLIITTGLLAKLSFAILLFGISSKKFVKTAQTIALLPSFLSMVIVSYMVYALLNPKYGTINQLLGTNIDWYAKPEAWPAILAIVANWKAVGMSSIIFYAALVGIEDQYFEAAELDGATRWNKIRYIMIPHISKLIVMTLIMDVGGIFGSDFGLFYQVTRNSTLLYPTTDVISTYIFRALTELGNTSMGSAVGLLQNVVGFILVVVTNQLAKKVDPDYGLF